VHSHRADKYSRKSMFKEKGADKNLIVSASTNRSRNQVSPVLAAPSPIPSDGQDDVRKIWATSPESELLRNIGRFVKFRARSDLSQLRQDLIGGIAEGHPSTLQLNHRAVLLV